MHKTQPRALNNSRNPSRPIAWGSLLRALSVPLALLLTGAMVWGASAAAFTASTSNPGNAWSTAVVNLSDSAGGGAGSSGEAMFDVERFLPGESHSRCITVVSGSSVPTRLTMYGRPDTGAVFDTALGVRLYVSVHEGTDGGNPQPNCTSFSPAGREPSHQGWLANFPPEGISSAGYVLPSQDDGGRRAYKITIKLTESNDAVADRALAGTAISGTFGWEAQSIPPP